MFYLVKGALLLGALMLLGCAGEAPDMRPRFDEQERFPIFREYLIDAGRDMGVVAKDGKGGKGILAPMRDDTLSLAEPLEVVRMPALVVDGVEPVRQYVIRIAPDFLRRAPDAYLRFGVAHEICHLKHGHVHARGHAESQEVEANGCACQYVGKARCIEVHRYLARLLNIKALQRLSDAEMERHLMATYGIVSFEKP